MKSIGLLVLTLTTFTSFAQMELIDQESPYAERDFLILASTTDLNEAVAIARSAAQKTGLAYKDNGLKTDKSIGATFPADSCKSYGFEFPCYVARGRYDDGGYVSVEYSNAYDGFQKGYFIVVGANGYKDNEEFKQALKSMKKKYPKSYVKRTRVYLGCMH